MIYNNPKLYHVNMNAYIKFGEKMSVNSQAIELSETKFQRKSRAITLVQICEK